MRRPPRHRSSPALALVLGLLLAGSARANSTGILRSMAYPEGVNCNACHTGGTTPDVEIVVGDGDGVAIGATVPVRVRIQAVNGNRGGFNLLTSDGVLDLHPEHAVRIEDTGAYAGLEATHSNPATVDLEPGIVEFILNWTAPETLDTAITFSALGVSSSGGGNAGTAAGAAEVQVTTRCPRYWPDADGDGWGVGEEFIETCDEAPEGHGPNHGDCDDTDPDIHPGMVELCNGIDDNCDGEIDEPRFTPPPMCSTPGDICWDGTCQPPPGLDGGTDAGTDGGTDGGTGGGSDGGTRPDSGYVIPESEILIVSGGCSAAGAGALPLALLIGLGVALRSRRRD